MRTILAAVILTMGGSLLLGSPPAGQSTPLPEFRDFLHKQKGLTRDAFLARTVPRPTAPDRLNIDLENVQYLELIQKRIKPKPEAQPLTAPEKTALSDQGFVVLDSRAFPSFGDAFYDVFANDQPLFITSDALLHAFHKGFDRMLLDLETVYLSPLLSEILETGSGGLGEIRKAGGNDPVVLQAVDDVEFLFDVGRELLKGSVTHPKPRIDQVLRAIASETALAVPFLGSTREVDFSQFRPRGHYTKSDVLKRYFRAMMWLGREDLSFRISDSFRETVAAFLMADALKRSGAILKWDEFDQMISFLIGTSDGAGPRDLLALLEKLGYPNFEEFVRRATPADTLARIGEGKIGEQKILSAIFKKDPGAPPFQMPKSAQLLGQRFTLDSYLFSQLTYDRLPGEVKRMLPQPLDLPAALGQSRAIELLQPELGRFGHHQSLAACIEFVRALPEPFWKENVYHGWLDALRELAVEPPGKAPPLVKTRAWADLKLQTQLASWAQLRHDTILYAKQSYTLGITCEYCDVYVEPVPAFFEKLRALCERIATLLREPPSGSKEAKEIVMIFRAQFKQFASIVGRLKTVAEKQLAGASMSLEERRFLRAVVEVKRSRICGGPEYFLTGWYPRLFLDPKTSMEWDPTIADVHTQPTDEFGRDVGRILHAGVGNVHLAAFLVQGHDGTTRAYLGPVFSYYEVIEGGYNRLTDEKWKERIGCPATRLSAESVPVAAKGPPPRRPAWADGLLGR